MTLCSWCDERFDDFVEEQLCADDHALFLRHVEFCDACKSAIDAHYSFIESAGKLQKTTDRQHAKCLLDIIKRVRRTIRLRQLFVATKASAALLLVGAISWAFYSARPPGSSDVDSPKDLMVQHPVKQADVNSPEPSEAIPKARVEIEDSQYVAVPIENKNPNITIYWLHPTFTPDDLSENDSSSINQHEPLFASKSL